MTRICMRPGCDRPAAARLSYNTVTCQVWLDLMPTRPGPVQEICDFHAEHLTVPRGWMLCDRRIEEPALFVPTVAGGAATSTRTAGEGSTAGRPAAGPRKQQRRQNRAKGPKRSIRMPAAADESDDVGRLASPSVASSQRPPRNPHPTELTQALFSDEADDVREDLDVREDRTARPASGPASNGDEAVDDDLPDSLRASSPLLSRAFRATGPQKSVLTQALTGTDGEGEDTGTDPDPAGPADSPA